MNIFQRYEKIAYVYPFSVQCFLSNLLLYARIPIMSLFSISFEFWAVQSQFQLTKCYNLYIDTQRDMCERSNATKVETITAISWRCKSKNLLIEYKLNCSWLGRKTDSHHFIQITNHKSIIHKIKWKPNNTRPNWMQIHNLCVCVQQQKTQQTIMQSSINCGTKYAVGDAAAAAQ